MLERSRERRYAHVVGGALETVLAHQFAIAWVGEGRCQPRRLGWWDTDLIDDAGGGDFLARIAPRTHAWASFEAAREAARRVDEKARKKMADPDAVRTLFFLGYDLDEQLADRLAALKREGRTPADALPFPFATSAFSKDALVVALSELGAEPHTIVPGGRQLRGTAPTEPDVLVRRLTAGLLPLSDQYPLPFFKVK